MTAGIAALIVLGTSAKKIFDFALRSGERKQVEANLIETRQRYNAFLVNDKEAFKKNPARKESAKRLSTRRKAIVTMQKLIAEGNSAGAAT